MRSCQLDTTAKRVFQWLEQSVIMLSVVGVSCAYFDLRACIYLYIRIHICVKLKG